MSGVFEYIRDDGYEQIVYCSDDQSGLRAIIAIHSTALGPALGGTRFYPYENDDDALVDVLRLAKGMTYKAAASGLDLGGGKAVILGDPTTGRSEALMRAYGRVAGVSVSLGGSGDPSPATAWGVLWALRAVVERRTGSASLDGVRVAVSG